jgi:hypothetical protein
MFSFFVPKRKVPKCSFPSKPTTTSDRLLHRALFNCPHSEKIFASEYWPEYQASLSCLGSDLAESRVPGGTDYDVYQHSLLVFEIATYAMKYAHYRKGNCLAWLDLHHPDEQRVFARAAWRFSMAAPIGYVISKHTVTDRGSRYPWRPNLQNLDEYCHRSDVTVRPSNRTLSPRPISLLVYERLYSHCPDYEYTTSAIADAFSESPNLDNPISIGFRKSLHTIISNRRSYTYPYWWVELYNDQMSHRDDFVPIRYVDGVDVFNKTSQSPVAILEFLAKAIASDTLTLNRKGATFHRLEDRLYMVVPACWERFSALLDHPQYDASSLEQLFITEGFIGEDPVTGNSRSTWSIKPSGTDQVVGQANLLSLSDNATATLLPMGFEVDNNADFVRAL